MTIFNHPLANRSHATFTIQASSNHGESVQQQDGLHGSPTLPTQTATPTKRIPKGVVTGEIPLEAAKAYPLRIWTGTGLPPRIAYADLNSKNEKNTLSVKLLPNGAKGAEHPQIVMFVKGQYHVENLGYYGSNPFEWTTWMEFHLDARRLGEVIDALFKAKFALEAK